MVVVIALDVHQTHEWTVFMVLVLIFIYLFIIKNNVTIARGEWEGERGGKGTENKQHKWQVENRQEEGKNRIRNVEAKELTCMTHGHELQGRGGQDGLE